MAILNLNSEQCWHQSYADPNVPTFSTCIESVMGSPMHIHCRAGIWILQDRNTAGFFKESNLALKLHSLLVGHLGGVFTKLSW